MPLKTASFLFLAVALAAFLGWQQSRLAFDPVDRGFLAWLAGNSNQPSVSKPRQVILVRLDDEDRQTFEDWPLTRLDYAVILNNLKKRQPAAVAVAPALYWTQEDEFGTGLLRSHLDALPLVVLGYRFAMGENRIGLPSHLSPIHQVAGDLSRLPAFSTIQLSAEPGLADSTLSGFTHPSLLSLPGDDQTIVALLAKLGGEVLPSLPLQLASAALDTSAADLTIRLGDRSRLQIGALSLPVNASGGFTLPPDTNSPPSLLRLNAETLIDAAQAEEIVLENLPPAQRKALDQIKDAVVIIGDDSPAARIHQLAGGSRASTAELLARTTAAILAGGSPARLWPPLAQYALWAALIALGVFLMRYPKRRILFCAGVTFVVYIAGALLIFQSTRSWTSPVPPLALIATIAFWGILIPPPKPLPAQDKNQLPPTPGG